MPLVGFHCCFHSKEWIQWRHTCLRIHGYIVLWHEHNQPQKNGEQTITSPYIVISVRCPFPTSAQRLALRPARCQLL